MQADELPARGPCRSSRTAAARTPPAADADGRHLPAAWPRRRTRGQSRAGYHAPGDPVTGRVVLRAECGDHGFVPFPLLSPISFRVPSPVPPPPRSVSAVLTKSRHSCFCVFFFSFCHFPTCSENKFPLTLTSAQGAPPQGTAGGQSQPATDISRGRDSCVLLSVSV